jgi:hypothetical protein
MLLVLRAGAGMIFYLLLILAAWWLCKHHYDLSGGDD